PGTTQQRASGESNQAWERSDFAACIRDCFKDLEGAQVCVVTDLQGDAEVDGISVNLLRLNVHLSELRDRLKDELEWDDRVVKPTIDAQAMDESEEPSAVRNTAPEVEASQVG